MGYSTQPTASSSQRLGSTVSLRHGTLTLSPPSDASPQLSQAAAVQVAQHSGILPGVTGGASSPIALFATLTDRDYGTMAADGSVAPAYVGRPVWAVEYPGARVPLFGSYTPGQSTAQGSYAATLYVFVDARSGKYLFAVADSSS